MIILAAVLALVAVVAGAALAEAMYGVDLVCQRLACQRCGAIMPGAGHECSERR